MQAGRVASPCPTTPRPKQRQPFGSDDIQYLEQQVHAVLVATDEVQLAQAVPRGNLSAHPRDPALLDACAETIVASFASPAPSSDSER